MRYLRKDIRRSARLGRPISLYNDVWHFRLQSPLHAYYSDIWKNKTEISRKYIINYIFCVDKAKLCRHEPRNHVIRKIKLSAFDWQYIVGN